MLTLAGFIAEPEDGFLVTESDTFDEINTGLQALFQAQFEWMDRDNGAHKQPNPDFETGQAPYFSTLPAYFLATKDRQKLEIAVCRSPYFSGRDVIQFCRDPRRGSSECILFLCMSSFLFSDLA